MRETKKIFLTGILLGVLIIFSVNIVSAICCERTIGVAGAEGGICVDVGDVQYCNDEFRIGETTACESTTWCKEGTCVNNVEGTCMPSPSAACDPSLGGYWYDDFPEDIEECKDGCCLIGEGAAFVPQTTCYKMAAVEGVQPDFRATVTTQEECLLMGGPTNKGACVFQTERGRECTIETREECSDDREFHNGFLCSAPDLGTICTMTKRTTCVEGRHEVFFEDSCGNTANVYDSGLVTDIPYWTYMKDPASTEICGYGGANIESPTCGNCNYIGGSTCAAKRIGESVDYGNYICRDLSCNYNGVEKEHGDAWCSQPISDFENAKPGDSSYRLYCYNGEVQWELCGNLREKLCKEDGDILGEANCLPNRWQDCTFQNNAKDCGDTDTRDCKIQKGTNKKDEDGEYVLFDNSLDGSKDMIEAVCVPRYPPAFNFWEPDEKILGVTSQLTPTQVCGMGSVVSTAGFHKRLTTRWWAIEGNCFAKCIEDNEEEVLFKGTKLTACFKDCPDSKSFVEKTSSENFKLGDVELLEEWAQEQEGLCIALGDCGVKANYIREDSYYSWKELFTGDDISKSNIPRANEHT